MLLPTWKSRGTAIYHLTQSLVSVIEKSRMIQVITINPSEPHLHGATLAQRHIGNIVEQLSGASSHPALVLLDLEKTTSVTASYLRGTVLWAILCGQAETDKSFSPGAGEAWAVRPMPLFASVMNCSSEIASDIHDFFGGRGLPILEILEMSSPEVRSSRLLGQLDPILFRTLQEIAGRPEITAAELSENSQEKITINGWSNRLFDLYRLRLVTRRREGKFWKYSAISKSINLWG